MERKVDEMVVTSVIKIDYSKIDMISKTAITVVAANAPIYLVFLFENALKAELQPNWQSILYNFGPMLGHYAVTSGLYLGLRSRVNSILKASVEEPSSEA